MIVSAGDKIIAFFAVVNFIGIFFYIGVSYYFCLTKMNLMLSYLKNCPSVTLRRPSLALGLSGKFYVFIAITAVLTVPRRMIRIGGASAEDIANFPTDLRRKIIWLHWSGMTMLLILCVLALIVEFELI